MWWLTGMPGFLRRYALWRFRCETARTQERKLRWSEVVKADKCHRRGGLGAGNKTTDGAGRVERAAMPRQTGYVDFGLTVW